MNTVHSKHKTEFQEKNKLAIRKFYLALKSPVSVLLTQSDV